MKENQIIYVLTNAAMPGIVKIGKTTQSGIKNRMSQLYSTGVPVPFDCEYAVEVDDCKAVEQALHTAFDPHRINPKREFFEIDPEQAIAILKLLGTKEVTPNIKEQLNENVSPAERASAEKRKKRPSIDFIEMGLSIGDELTYAEDDSIIVKIENNKQILYNGEIMSLTKATKIIRNIDYNILPTRFWFYKGRNLREIWEETYVNNEE